jgi:NitT/TauT family transport system substrate-binding protein
MELLMKSEGMVLDDVRMISAGLSWEDSSSVLRAGGVDAILTDLSFAARLMAEGKGYSLANYGELSANNKIPGSHYLHATLSTREDLIAQQPQLAGKMVSILRRSLVWIKNHTPEQVVEQMHVVDEFERKALLSVLQANLNLYSPDGRFSDAQMKDTEVFFRYANKDDQAAQALKINSVIDERWAGVKP